MALSWESLASLSNFDGFLAVAGALGIGCTIRIPDLTVLEASVLISRAPEFNRYARLLKVERVNHLGDSMNSVSFWTLHIRSLELSVEFAADQRMGRFPLRGLVRIMGAHRRLP